MAQFASGTFTGSDGTELSAHDAAWTKQSGTPNLQIAANRIRPSTSGAVYYYHSGTPAGADYSVSSDLYCVTNTVESAFGVCGRGSTSAVTFYHARYSAGSGAWQLYSASAGSFTLLGSYSQTLSNSTNYVLKLEMIGTAIKVYIDTVERISVTNSTHTGAGKSGTRANNTSGISDSTGQHLDNFSADDIGGGPTYTLTADGGAYTHTGGAAGLVAGRKVIGSGGAFAFTGGDAALQAGRKLAADGGAYAFTGGDAGLFDGHKLIVDGGAFAFTGGDATFTYTPVGGATYTLSAGGGAYAFTGGDAAFLAARKLVVDGGAFAFSGGNADFTYPYVAPVATPRRHAGFRREQVRKGYIIKGKRYWLTEDELMQMVAQEITAISRKEVKQITAGKPKPISKKVWDLIAPMERLQALTPIEAQDDDEEDVLMMFV